MSTDKKIQQSISKVSGNLHSAHLQSCQNNLSKQAPWMLFEVC